MPACTRALSIILRKRKPAVLGAQESSRLKRPVQLRWISTKSDHARSGVDGNLRVNASRMAHSGSRLSPRQSDTPSGAVESTDAESKFSTTKTRWSELRSSWPAILHIEKHSRPRMQIEADAQRNIFQMVKDSIAKILVCLDLLSESQDAFEEGSPVRRNCHNDGVVAPAIANLLKPCDA